MRTYSRRKPQPQKIEDVQTLCRLCLGKTEEMIPIFGKEVNDVFATIPMRIMMCVGLEVTRDDQLPKRICQKCNNELNKFYTFKKNCNVTFRKLKDSLMTVKKVDKNTNEIELNITEETNESDFKRDNISTESVKNTVTEDLNENQKTQINEPGSSQVVMSVPVGSLEGSIKEHNTMDEAREESGLQTQKDQKKENQGNKIVKESIPSYLINALVEKGVLAKQGDLLEILDQDVKTFHLESAYGSRVVMELVEEEPEVPVANVYKIQRPKLFETGGQINHTRCGECGVRFASRGGLNRHMRVHSGERPYACRTCGRRFAQREVMRRHELLHADKRPYQCGACPKAYTQRGALEAHVRSHAPPEARALALHRCTRCTKVFLYASGLSRHMLQVHQGHRVACAECPRVFRDASSAQRHARAHHRRNS
ncbi:uncharacterized protein [Epargyreus clarus]|uniref:uncharacterized protein n=1 Tax=Epargyreus clarus TaxID=520877 RepID=UPI003C2F79AE